MTRSQRLTLQPVVGKCHPPRYLETTSKSGTIVLTGWQEDRDLVLLISDDGVGMSNEKLDTILTGTGSSSGKGTNIAIYNTHRRLQILYGLDYGLFVPVSQERERGVQIRIPARKASTQEM